MCVEGMEEPNVDGVVGRVVHKNILDEVGWNEMARDQGTVLSQKHRDNGQQGPVEPNVYL